MRANHDIHIHNYLSKCCADNQATVEAYVEEAKKTGLKLMGFANHTWDETVTIPDLDDFYKSQSMAFMMQIKSQIPKDDKIKVLVGAETEYSGIHNVIGMSSEAAKQLDYLLIPHSHVHFRDFTMSATDDVHKARAKVTEMLAAIEGICPESAAKMAKVLSEQELEAFMDVKHCDFIQHTADYMVASFRGVLMNEKFDELNAVLPISVAHPFQPVGSYALRPQMLERISDNTFGELFELAAKKGVGLEINRATNFPEVIRFFAIAKECGCKFTLGTDLHRRGEFDTIFKTDETTDALGLTEYDFMDFVRV